MIGISSANQMRFGIVILSMVQNACFHQVVRVSIGSHQFFRGVIHNRWFIVDTVIFHDIKWEEQIHINCCNHQISELEISTKQMDASKEGFVAAQIVSLFIFAAVRSDWKKQFLRFLVLRHTTVNDNES